MSNNKGGSFIIRVNFCRGLNFVKYKSIIMHGAYSQIHRSIAAYAGIKHIYTITYYINNILYK